MKTVYIKYVEFSDGREKEKQVRAKVLERKENTSIVEFNINGVQSKREVLNVELSNTPHVVEYANYH